MWPLVCKLQISHAWRHRVYYTFFAYQNIFAWSKNGQWQRSRTVLFAQSFGKNCGAKSLGRMNFLIWHTNRSMLKTFSNVDADRGKCLVVTVFLVFACFSTLLQVTSLLWRSNCTSNTSPMWNSWLYYKNQNAKNLRCRGCFIERWNIPTSFVPNSRHQARSHGEQSGPVPPYFFVPPKFCCAQKICSIIVSLLLYLFQTYNETKILPL